MTAVAGVALAGLAGSGCISAGATAQKIGAAPSLRVNEIAAVKPGAEAEIRQLYARTPDDVRKALVAASLRNYSVFLKTIDGRPFLCRYFEYEGTQLAADLARAQADPAVKAWLGKINALLLPGDPARPASAWETAEEVFHTDGAAAVIPKQVRRVGSITGLRPEKEAWYRTLHATPWPQVNATIRNANIRNYTIGLKAIGDRLYLWSYFEYVGDNFDADMKKIAECPVTRRWWKETDPCQLPLPAAAAKGQIWDDMEEVFYNN